MGTPVTREVCMLCVTGALCWWQAHGCCADRMNEPHVFHQDIVITSGCSGALEIAISSMSCCWCIDLNNHE